MKVRANNNAKLIRGKKNWLENYLQDHTIVKTFFNILTDLLNQFQHYSANFEFLL